ncbi:MAG TPA: hypothetical protein VIC35_06635 [Acidimicrobiia bacterium]
MNDNAGTTVIDMTVPQGNYLVTTSGYANGQTEGFTGTEQLECDSAAALSNRRS